MLLRRRAADGGFWAEFEFARKTPEPLIEARREASSLCRPALRAAAAARE